MCEAINGLSWPMSFENTEDSKTFKFLAAGRKLEDLSVTYEDDSLVIKVNETDGFDENEWDIERIARGLSLDYFVKSAGEVVVPIGRDEILVDKIESNLKDGILTVKVPYSPKAKAVKIEIANG